MQQGQEGYFSRYFFIISSSRMSLCVWGRFASRLPVAAVAEASIFLGTLDMDTDMLICRPPSGNSKEREKNKGLS